MTAHTILSAFHDEDWCVTCSCGQEFFSAYRAKAEDAQRQHVIDEGLADVRASLEGKADGS